jgi:hypothetical protein
MRCGFGAQYFYAAQCLIMVLHSVSLWYCTLSHYGTAQCLMLLHSVSLCYCKVSHYGTAQCLIMVLHSVSLWYCTVSHYVTAQCLIMVLHSVSLWYCTMSHYGTARKSICTSVPFAVHLQGQAVQVSSWTAWPVKKGWIPCPGSSVMSYRPSPRNIPDQRKRQY